MQYQKIKGKNSSNTIRQSTWTTVIMRSHFHLVHCFFSLDWNLTVFCGSMQKFLHLFVCAFLIAFSILSDRIQSQRSAIGFIYSMQHFIHDPRMIQTKRRKNTNQLKHFWRCYVLFFFSFLFFSFPNGCAHCTVSD